MCVHEHGREQLKEVPKKGKGITAKSRRTTGDMSLNSTSSAARLLCGASPCQSFELTVTLSLKRQTHIVGGAEARSAESRYMYVMAMRFELVQSTNVRFGPIHLGVCVSPAPLLKLKSFNVEREITRGVWGASVGKECLLISRESWCPKLDVH